MDFQELRVEVEAVTEATNAKLDEAEAVSLLSNLAIVIVNKVGIQRRASKGYDVHDGDYHGGIIACL